MRYRDEDDVRRAVAHGHLSREAGRLAEREGTDSLNRALGDATFGRGPLADETGDPFKDDPFFNPWAEGGAFNS